MANYFQAASDIVASCVADYQSLTGIVVDPNDLTRDEVVKFWWIGNAVSHFYSALQAAYNNFFPQTADVNGLNSGLEARGLPTQEQPTPSNGSITITGVADTDFPQGTQVSRNLTGDIYVSQADANTGSGGTVAVPFQSLGEGQNLNIANVGEAFTVIQPPTGIDTAVFSITAFADGTDLETPAAMLLRIEAFDQNEQTGGNLAAYEEYAEAVSGVVTASAISRPDGPDTVGVVITSGTTDIADAVNNNEPVVRVPSDTLVAEVQAYIETQNPTTDIVTVSGATESPFNVTFNYKLYNESLRPQTDAAIQKIIAIYLYSALSQQVLEPTDIERLVDQQLGFLIPSRECENFGGGDPEYQIPFGTIVKPGTITLNTYS